MSCPERKKSVSVAGDGLTKKSKPEYSVALV